MSVGPRSTEETIHPVQLIFDNIDRDYRLSPSDRELILQFVEDRIDGSLADAFDLVKVDYAGSWNGRQLLTSRQVGRDRLAMPLLVRVRGPIDASGYALSYVLQSIRQHLRAIELYVKSLDNEIFEVSCICSHVVMTFSACIPSYTNRFLSRTPRIRLHQSRPTI